MHDKEIAQLITREEERQKNTLNLIASENYVSREVREVLGSVFTNKYAEGYPTLRYYNGNAVIDELENCVKMRALKLFNLSPEKWSVNVQSLSGSPANLAVYLALVPFGHLPAGRQGKIMGMELSHGGHLTHGHKVSITGKLWKQIPYGVNKKTETFDYKEILNIAKREKPKLIVAGYTAYSRIIDWKKFRKIADTVGAIFMVDMSHIAGLIAGGVYPSPFSAKGGQNLADVVTTTTHKTLRGPRAAMIFSKKEFASKIDKAVFPGLQGGPHMNTIAALGIALHEAAQPHFKKYVKQIIKNTRVLAQTLQKEGWRIISGGTDTHLFLVDTFSHGISGSIASDTLEKVGITVNKNTIPFDMRSPMDPSGIRLGTAALTTRGMKEKEMREIGALLHTALTHKESDSVLQKKIKILCKKFPCF